MSSPSVSRPARRRFRISDLMIESPGLSDHTEFEDQTLREKSRWIRDTLDPEIAREGPSYLDDRHIVTLVKFLRDLIRARISVDQLARTRIHHAVMCIAGRATRWPKPLIQEADKIIRHWSIRYGSLHEIPGTLYEPGGRLHGVCLPQDIDKEVLEIKWLRAKDSKTIGGYARRHGDMGIEAGSWWINTMFAYHAGVLDSGDPTGRIVHDKHGAYALLLTDSDEYESDDPLRVLYRAKQQDKGRYRLTSGTPASRNPLRVLRSYTLGNSWAPGAGVRYDGLYNVFGWKITYDNKRDCWYYDIEMHRVSGQTSMDAVLQRPWKEELDDHKEYKRQRAAVQQTRNPFHRAPALTAQINSGLGEMIMHEVPMATMLEEATRGHARNAMHSGKKSGWDGPELSYAPPSPTPAQRGEL